MTSVATFEFSTEININRIVKEVSEIWCNGSKSNNVDIHKKNSIFLSETQEKIYICVLEYIFFRKEEEPKIRLIVDYLLSISDENKLFYYRDYDVIDLCIQDEEPIEIDVDDIFTNEFCPAMSGDINHQYLIQRANLAKDN